MTHIKDQVAPETRVKLNPAVKRALRNACKFIRGLKSNFGSVDMFILRARAPELFCRVQKFLKSDNRYYMNVDWDFYVLNEVKAQMQSDTYQHIKVGHYRPRPIVKALPTSPLRNEVDDLEVLPFT
ncbi:hypothetical protein L1077_23175 [Pseudoalteromonas luteoviolacea]|uniref:hypothetical protein n=1 Tax=Pseudoalteromonas luteoviolacea TaxID=43657 RepID=UPI001F23CDE3|nr:hypothetical protein [Pseudoalteromonas luteoviolacea]MCF6442333.1 hypothetical protein [Pseudoalteromonas luteoviolacea]